MTDGIAGRGAAEVVDAGEGDLAGQLAALIGDPPRLAAMSLAASTLCDGQGAARVAERLLAIL